MAGCGESESRRVDTPTTRRRSSPSGSERLSAALLLPLATGLRAVRPEQWPAHEKARERTT